MRFRVRVGTRKATTLKKQEQATAFPAFFGCGDFQSRKQTVGDSMSQYLYQPIELANSPFHKKRLKIFCATNEEIMLHLDEKIQMYRTFSLL
jgi:hypothetical protein